MWVGVCVRVCTHACVRMCVRARACTFECVCVRAYVRIQISLLKLAGGLDKLLALFLALPSETYFVRVIITQKYLVLLLY